MKKTLEGLLQKAEVKRNAGLATEALSLFLKSAELAKQDEDYQGVAHSLYRAGVTAKLFIRSAQDTKYRDAIQFLLAAKDLFTEQGNEVEVGKVYRDIAITHDYARQKSAALESFTRAVTIFQKIGADGELALTYAKIGLHYAINNDTATAKQFYDQSSKYFQRAPSGFYQAIYWQDYAKLLAKLNEVKSAIDWAEQSLSWYDADHDGVVFQRKVAQLYGLLSVLYDLDGREKLAKNYATRYERLLKTIDPEVVLSLRQELAQVFPDEASNTAN